MKDNKLISMVSYVEFIMEELHDSELDYFEALQCIENYSIFLLQPLTLGMFVPCDENGNVMEDLPKSTWSDFNTNDLSCEDTYDECIQYQQAKERVLFEGFEITEDYYKATKRTFVSCEQFRVNTRLQYYKGNVTNSFSFEGENIEHLLKYDLTLTPNALKQLNQ